MRIGLVKESFKRTTGCSIGEDLSRQVKGRAYE